jgi:hypothetical protein
MLMRTLRGDCSRTAVWLLLTTLLPFGLKAADSAVIFGLGHQALNGASIVPREGFSGLRVEDLVETGDRGVSVALGDADSGLFFSPQLNSQPEDTNFMSARVFGRVAGHESLVGTVSCKRDGYGLYPMSVDFTAIGSSNLTVQVYCYGLLVREETNTSGNVTFHTDSVGNLFPRVNPCWRAPDGSLGVLVDFQLSVVDLPQDHAFGNRVFIKAEHPLSSVDYLSRVEIYGGGGLSYFEGSAEWLGLNSLPHMALGSAVFNASRGNLSIEGLGESGEDGVMVDLGGAASYRMDLQPFALPTNSTVRLSANGPGDNYFFFARNFLGPVVLHNTNENVEVSAIFGGDETNLVRIRVLNDGVLSGSLINQGGTFGSISNGTWKIAGCGARPDSPNDPSAIYISFDRWVSFQPAGGGAPITGNQLLFSWHEPGPENGTFLNFQLQTTGLPSFAISGEATTPPAPQTISIARSADAVQVSWPYRVGLSDPQTTSDLTVNFDYTNLPPYQLIGSRLQMSVPLSSGPQRFFRLWNWCLAYNKILQDSD